MTDAALFIAVQVSWVKYFLHISKQTFSSIHDDDIISGLISTSSTIIVTGSAKRGLIAIPNSQLQLFIFSEILKLSLHLTIMVC